MLVSLHCAAFLEMEKDLDENEMIDSNEIEENENEGIMCRRD